MFGPGPGMTQAFITLIFIVIIGTILFRVISGLNRWQRNNQQPVLTVSAKIVSKRTHISRHTHQGANNMPHTTSTTHYFATFEFESGDRLELEVKDWDYGMLVEGDTGKLTFQGTRFKGFERA